MWDRRSLLLVPAALAVAAGCARSKPRVHVVRIVGMAFGEMPKDARVDDIIEWVNADPFQHTATARDGAFDVDLAPGAKGRTELTASGEQEVYCRYHPAMTARLYVQA
jgi:plastocyanin